MDNRPEFGGMLSLSLMNKARSLTPSVLLIALLSGPAIATESQEPERDPRMISLIDQAQKLVEAKKPTDAIDKCDQIIAAFTERYRGSKEQVYCGREPVEKGAYLVKAAGENLKKGASKRSAIVLSSTWADAYFIKAYALQDLHRLNEAKATVKLALALSPFNSHYLNELGEIYQLEKDGQKAREQFKTAEDNASLAPHETRADDLARARRGSGYVFTELGDFDAAERKYKQCLATNPNDKAAKNELEYIRQLRAKSKQR